MASLKKILGKLTETGENWAAIESVMVEKGKNTVQVTREEFRDLFKYLYEGSEMFFNDNFYIYTPRWIFFLSNSDIAEYVEAIPRHPNPTVRPEVFGGG